MQATCFSRAAAPAPACNHSNTRHTHTAVLSSSAGVGMRLCLPGTASMRIHTKTRHHLPMKRRLWGAREATSALMWVR